MKSLDNLGLIGAYSLTCVYRNRKGWKGGHRSNLIWLDQWGARISESPSTAYCRTYTSIPPLSLHSSLPRKQQKKYGFTVGEKSEMEYGGKQNWRLPEAPGGSWRRPKMSSSKALSQWIEGWTVLRGSLRCVKIQICAILVHPWLILICASLKRKIPPF